MILKIVREGLGRLIILIDWVFSPSRMKREPEVQAMVEDQVKSMQLYQLYACPFCVKTRRALKKLNLPIQTLNVHLGSPHRSELEQGGGRIQVPCLKMRQDGEDVWMYESSNIVRFLEKQFG